jgi:MULE transposase domain
MTDSFMTTVQTTSLDLLRRFPSTIVLDSTYKTNRHNMYLFDLVGVTATNSSFIIGQAFLSAETTEDYEWVLQWLHNYYVKAQLPAPKSISTDKAGGLANAVESVFPGVPHLLCIWHVNNDVEAYCRKLWKGEIDSTKGHTTVEERSTFMESRPRRCRSYEGSCQASIQGKTTTTRSKGRGSATRAKKVRARPRSSKKEPRALIDGTPLGDW